MPRRTRQSSGASGCLARGGIRLVIAGVIAAVAIVGYVGTRSQNPVTGEMQHVDLTPQQEIALGLQSAPDMTREFGGPSRDPAARAQVERVGARLVQSGVARDAPYPFEFHLLADPDVVNAFALPGGQIFITEALYDRLDTEGQLAGVLGHEMGHVIERHGAQHLAKQKLTAGLVGAAGVAGSDPDIGVSGAQAAAVAAAVGQLINLRYGREDELESDTWGVQIMSEAGYDPRALIRVMEVLEEASRGGRPPEFLSTHPTSAHRIEQIRAAIGAVYPDGVPEGLEP